MLNIFNSFIICSLAMAVGVMASGEQQERSPARYVASRDVNYLELKAYKYIGAELDKRGLLEPSKIHEFLSIINSDEYRKPNVNPFVLGDTVVSLRELASPEADCKEPLVKIYSNIVKSIYGDLDVMNANRGDTNKPSHDVGLFNYLHHYGKEKFAACSSSLMLHDYEEALPKVSEKFEPNLDKLVGSQIDDSQAQLSDSRLAEVASKIDLIEGHFDASKMLQVAKKNYPGKQSDLSSSSLLRLFISINCGGMLYRIETILDFYNLNRLVNPSSPTATGAPDKLIKFNEYAAFCRPSTHGDTQDQVEAIIENQLANPIVKLFNKCTNCLSQ